MRFLIQLIAPIALEPIQGGEETRTYDQGLDDIRSIFHDICNEIQYIPGILFIAEACSDSPWPVSVGVDLCIVAEQLHDLIQCIGAGAPATLSFYEQGIQKTLRFTRKNEIDVVVECADMIPTATSRTDMMQIERQSLLDLLCRLGEEFVRVARLCCPEKASHPWFMQWSSKLNELISSVERSGSL